MCSWVKCENQWAPHFLRFSLVEWLYLPLVYLCYSIWWRNAGLCQLRAVMPTAHQPEREALLPVWYGFISHSTHVIVKGKDVQSLVRTGLSFYKNLTTFNDPLWLMFFFIISILTFTDTALGSTWNWSPTCWICRSKLKILKWIALLYCFWPCLASAIFFLTF